jgi:hypothetical protein
MDGKDKQFAGIKMRITECLNILFGCNEKNTNFISDIFKSFLTKNTIL